VLSVERLGVRWPAVAFGCGCAHGDAGLYAPAGSSDCRRR
jgi:hypothetical protein